MIIITLLFSVFEDCCMMYLHRGTADKKGEKPFRDPYGRVGHLRGFTRAPFLCTCMTATASSRIRQKIIGLLNMKNTKLIRQSPVKMNIYYSAKKASHMEETFQWMFKKPANFRTFKDNPDGCRYTWRRQKPEIHCRLDFFLVSQSLTCNITNSDILACFKTDHSLITIKLSLHLNRRGPGFWKLNMSLLVEDGYAKQIKTAIKVFQEEYQEDNTVNAALTWEMIKLKVRE